MNDGNERPSATSRRAPLLVGPIGLALLLVLTGAVSSPLGAPTIGAAPLPPSGLAPAPSVAAHPASAPPLAPPRAPRLLPPLPGPTASAPPVGTWTGPFAHLPSAWRGASAPPGALALRRTLGPAGAGGPAYGNLSHPTDPNGNCYGIWPTDGGQSGYADNCYGHDEPGIQFYSTLPGSGGNVTWNVTLPIGRNSTNLQADLYTAIWFGMSLTDPYAWMNQCFLELQFYPDSDWNIAGTVPGSWVGAAVAWQIEAATGYEDACFYQPLTTGSGGLTEFNMTQGDRISVTMSGWARDPYGENLTIADLSNGETSSVNLYNTGLGYPLDPAYTTNVEPNALEWTPGGELPVVFAFETGHTIAPYPNTNGYGGCSSGPPPPTSADPAVPCPSYDPGSWVNDTASPWTIQAPTFFNGAARERPAQVSFTQDLGGQAIIDPLSNGTCDGRDGSAWCTYPWYSYSCLDDGFHFGATDYLNTTTDFGASYEYAENYATDALQLSFVPPTNFSIPTCSAPAYAVTVAPFAGTAGDAYFLSRAVAGSTDFTVGGGEYSIAALPRPGWFLGSWSTSGGVRVVDATSPVTTLWVTGNGTVQPVFTTTPPGTTTVTFRDRPSGGTVAVLPSFFFTNGIPIATVANGGTLQLAPGVYSIQADSPVGSLFGGWTATGDNASVAGWFYPSTWLVIPSSGAAVTVTATSVTSTGQDAVSFGTYYGNGNVSLDGSAFTSSSSATLTVGTYALVAHASPGWALSAWVWSSSAVLTDYAASTNVTLENGSTYYLYAEFEPLVTIAASPAGDGAISLDGGVPAVTQSVNLYPGVYLLDAVPAAGFALASWAVSRSADLWVTPATGGGEWLTVNASGTATATFSAATNTTVTFAANPSTGGGVEFNFDAYAAGAANTSVAAGTYLIAPRPSPGYNFTGWSTSGTLSVGANGVLTVGSSGGTLTADYARGRYPVTVTTDPPFGITVTVGSGFSAPTIATGVTLWLTGSAVPLAAHLPAGLSVAGWTGSPNDPVTAGAAPTVSVNGPGTVGLLTTGFLVVANVSPNHPIDVGQRVTLSAVVFGGGSYSYDWFNLPTGCRSVDTASFSCAPTGPGSFNVSVTVNSTLGVSRTIVAGQVDVNALLAANEFSASPANFTLGRSTILSVRAIGGALPYEYAYAGLPANCSGGDFPTVTCTPNQVGPSDVQVKVTDALGAYVFGALTIVTNPPPSVVQLNVSRVVTDVGVPLTVSAWVGGGTAPLTLAYSGLPEGCVGAGAGFSCTPRAAGNFTIEASVTDADGFASTQTAALQVRPGPAIASFGPTGQTVNLNASFSLSATVGGGVSPYRFTYAGLPAGCFSVNASTLPCRPTQAGDFAISLIVTDAVGRSATAQANVTVAANSTECCGSPGNGPHNVTASPLTAIGGPWVLVAVALGVVAAVLLWRWRRRPNGPASAEGETPTAAEESPPE